MSVVSAAEAVTAAPQSPKESAESQQVAKRVSVFSPNGLPCCRMCLEEDQAANMVEPCLCRGSQQFAHEACLVVWQEWQLDKEQDFVCAVCGGEYTNYLATKVKKEKTDLKEKRDRLERLEEIAQEVRG